MRKMLSEQVTEEKRAIREEVTRKRRDLRKVQALAEAWPADLPISSYHTYNLYGTAGTVKIGDSYSTYGREADYCSMAEVFALLDRLPPVPRYMRKDGCTSFPIAEWAEANQKGEDREVFPVLLDAEPGEGYPTSYAVKWCTRLGGQVWQVECILNPAESPVRAYVTASRDKYGRIIDILDCGVSTNPSYKGKFWMDQRIRWGRGSDTDPNRFTLYWLDVEWNPADGGPGATKAFRDTICGL